MVTFPNCKINLGLNVVRKRPDGYHDIQSVFLPVKWFDVLEILPSLHNETTLHISGLPCGPATNNLCLKAYELIRRDFPEVPPLSVYLHKTIPAGAGLGGGSSDAASMLLLLNQTFRLEISTAGLKKYAETLGSDCPFFIENKAAFATGRGESLRPVQLHLEEYELCLIYPGISISTADAFGGIEPTEKEIPIDQIVQLPVREWKHDLKNDFEQTVFKQWPVLKEIKDNLYNSGAHYASLSGTGSTVYGFFPKGLQKNVFDSMNVPSHWIIKWISDF